MKSKQRIALGIVFALAMALIGCGTPNVHQRHEAQFLPDPVDLKTPASCRVVLTQDDPFIAAKKTPPWGQMPVTAQGGLVGLAVTLTMNGVLKGANEIANEVREENASKRSAMLRGHGLGASFESGLQSSLTAALNSSSWFHAMPLEMSRDQRPLTVADLSEHPILELRFIYHLSYDASALVMQAHMDYFKQGQTNADHFRYYTYFSESVGPEKDDAAVAKWTASNNELLSHRIGEGMNEIIAMLNVDFLRPEWKDPSIPNTTISCYDALAQKQVKWEGHVLRQEGPRVVFQEKGGNLFSVIPE